MTRYQLAFAPFLNKYINDELSKHYGGRRVTGVLPGLQNQCGAWYVPGGFDSHMPPPKENMLLVEITQFQVHQQFILMRLLRRRFSILLIKSKE